VWGRGMLHPGGISKKKRNILSHFVTCRAAEAAGYSPKRLGENVALQERGEVRVRQAVWRLFARVIRGIPFCHSMARPWFGCECDVTFWGNFKKV
jgi:hypothetical protein